MENLSLLLENTSKDKGEGKTNRNWKYQYKFYCFWRQDLSTQLWLFWNSLWVDQNEFRNPSAFASQMMGNCFI